MSPFALVRWRSKGRSASEASGGAAQLPCVAVLPVVQCSGTISTRTAGPMLMTDQAEETDLLLERLRQGDPEALGPLFTRNSDRLRKMVEFRLDSRLQGRISPSDVLQEAYIDALKRLPHFQNAPDVPFFIWLRTVTIQRLIEFHRQHVGAKARAADREVPLNLGDGGLASTEKMAVFFVSMTSPSEAVQRAETITRVREALDRMVPMDREVLALRHFEELSNREVAALLGIQSAAASKRHVRALERLREVVEALTPDEGGTP